MLKPCTDRVRGRTHSRMAWAALALLIPGIGACIELRNDSFVEGSIDALFQFGFVTGEEAASRFTTCEGAHLRATRLVFGLGDGPRTVTLRVYDDSAGTDDVGAPIFSQDFPIESNLNQLSEFDLEEFAIVVPSRFRIGIAFQHDDLPSIARDNDANIVAAANFVRLDVGGSFQWFRSEAVGVTTDWILRAEVDCPTTIFDDGFEG